VSIPYCRAVVLNDDASRDKVRASPKLSGRGDLFVKRGSLAALEAQRYVIWPCGFNREIVCGGTVPTYCALAVTPALCAPRPDPSEAPAYLRGAFLLSWMELPCRPGVHCAHRLHLPPRAGPLKSAPRGALFSYSAPNKKGRRLIRIGPKVQEKKTASVAPTGLHRRACAGMVNAPLTPVRL
jgi:hypothetical protein